MNSIGAAPVINFANGLRPLELSEYGTGYAQPVTVDSAVAPAAAGLDKRRENILIELIKRAPRLKKSREIVKGHFVFGGTIEGIAPLQARLVRAVHPVPPLGGRIG